MSRTGKVSSASTSFSGSFWQKFRHYLWQFLRAKSTTHLLDLNDDCLREILSFVTDEDLCSVAESSTEICIRLRYIATEIFKRSRKISNFNQSVCRIYEPQRIFQNFGSVFLDNVLTFTNLTSLRIDCHDQNVTQFIYDLKSLKSLTSLSLYSVHGDPEFVPALAKLKQLRSLHLGMCYELNDLNPLAVLDRLELLYIQERYSSDKLDFDIVQLVKHLMNLQSLCLIVSAFRLDKETYLRLVDVVRGRERIPQHIFLKISAVDDDVFEAQNAGYNRLIPKLPKILLLM